MEKEFTTLAARTAAESIVKNWDAAKNSLKLSPKALYHLIQLKKELEIKGQTIADTLMQIFTSHDCKLNDEQTGFIIPPEKSQEINNALTEFYAEKVVINYEPIVITDNDVIPTDLMEALFDFITFVEQ